MTFDQNLAYLSLFCFDQKQLFEGTPPSEGDFLCVFKELCGHYFHMQSTRPPVYPLQHPNRLKSTSSAGWRSVRVKSRDADEQKLKSKQLMLVLSLGILKCSYKHLCRCDGEDSRTVPAFFQEYI